jgi:hypothetical protein
MTALVDLRLSSDSTYSISASMLSGLQSLTRLQLAVPDRRKADARVSIEPCLLSGKTRLQHLELLHCDAGVAAYEGQLQARLGELQQLTYLSMRGSLHPPVHTSVLFRQRPTRLSQPAASCSTLTSIVAGQHLLGSTCLLRAGSFRSCGHCMPQFSSTVAACSAAAPGCGRWVCTQTGRSLRRCCSSGNA